MKNNHLSDIYSQKVLLNEEKSPVVKGAKELESKIGKAGLVGNQGPEKSKKNIETPEENKKYSDGAKAKAMKESTKSYEGAFEKLFKATITEQEMEGPGVEMEVEVPTEPEGMVDEIESEESGDLVSELRDIVDRLQEVLANLSDEDSDENELENESEGSEEGENEEEPYEESVKMEDKGHALHGMKSGTQMMSKGNFKVASKLKTSGGSVYKGELKDSPEPKELGDKKGSLLSKGSYKVKSSVNTGDFFK
jgi:coenzyme F420-reducing hydrogenase alpha subunit